MIETMDAQLLLYIGATSGLTKGMVDLARYAAPDKKWLPPAIAFPLGIILVLLFMVWYGEALTAQMIAGGIIAGLFSGLGAVAITSLHDARIDRVDAAALGKLSPEVQAEIARLAQYAEKMQ